MSQRVRQILFATLCVVATAIAAYFLLYFMALLPVAVSATHGFSVRVFFWVMMKPAGLCLMALSLWIVALWALRKGMKRRVIIPVVTGVPLVMFLLLGALPIRWGKRNRLGLVSFEPNSTVTESYDGARTKDNYPTCTFQYNSLGFRDREPELSKRTRHRVLVIGDSYVWGDGIPTNSLTVGALLRKKLARVSDQYTVVSAAYPGLGVYGYVRFLQRLKPYVKADIAVIAFIGDSDLDPFDSQFLIEQVPRNFFLKNVVMNLGVLQRIHEVSFLKRGTLWAAGPSRRRTRRAMQELAAYQMRENVKIILVNYFGYRDPAMVPGQIELLDLPERIRYPGGRNRYWYAKDMHPKPALNREVARLVADRIRELTVRGNEKGAARPD